MAQARREPSLIYSAYFFLELLFHTTVREVRADSGGNALLGLLTAVSRTLMLVAMFYMMYAVMGLKGAGIRGDVLLFLVSGVLLFLMHNAAVSKVLSAGNMAGALQQHAPMTPMLQIAASTLAQLYLHILALGIIMLILFLTRDNIEIADPVAMIKPFFLAWASGVVMGLLFLILKPFAPKAVMLISLVYQRANLVTSGKFFVANALPGSALPYFAWNPLFHCVDQMRGALFVNYVPHNSNMTYPTVFVAAGLVVGMMFEFWLRQTVSRSTGKR